jgi:hypothetical protein
MTQVGTSPAWQVQGPELNTNVAKNTKTPKQTQPKNPQKCCSICCIILLLWIGRMKSGRAPA